MRPDRERPARLHRHLPEVDAARVLEHGLDEIVIADRHAAGGEHHVGGAPRRGAGARGARRGGRARCRGRRPARRPRRRGRAARSGSSRRSARACARRRARPPRRRWRGWPRAGAGAPGAGEAERGGHAQLLRAEHACPRGSPRARPARPRRGCRTLTPRRWAGPMRTDVRSRSTISCGYTVSAPAGMGAPVMMRSACRSPTTPSNTAPAASSPTTGSSRRPPAGMSSRATA